MIDTSFPADQITFDDILFCPDGSAKNVLIACEESQEVCKAFRELGHRAFSCDIQECSGGHPEWHIKGDVIPLLDGNCEFVTEAGNKEKQSGKWDIVISHPPCTHLAVSGARHFETKRKDGRQKEGIELFCAFLEADCSKVAIENPVGIISGEYVETWFPDLSKRFGLPIKPTQIIQPWMFGDNYSKTTCLWLKGLPKLKASVAIKPELESVIFVDKKNGKIRRLPKWYADAWHLPSEERSKVRSKTFHGIAEAMAEQWGGKVI